AGTLVLRRRNDRGAAPRSRGRELHARRHRVGRSPTMGRHPRTRWETRCSPAVVDRIARDRARRTPVRRRQDAFGERAQLVVGAGGAIGDWIANNFYTLDAESEKGILAAMVPLDNYLADLNSGQAWYRPSYLLVAVLKHERVACRVQAAFERVYNHFYRHQLV